MTQETTNNAGFDINTVIEPEDINEVIYGLMVDPNLSPLNYFNDFSDVLPDPKVMGNDDIDDSGIFFDLGIGNIKLAMTTHAIHNHVETDPETAMEILVSRAARKMTCFGAKPVAVTSMLYHIDFGNPNGNLIASKAKKGLENAAKALNLKLSDRKIRFDHFSDSEKPAQTIIISLLGVFEDSNIKPLTPSFKKKGDNIFMIGKPNEDIASSEYLEFFHNKTASQLPYFKLDEESKIKDVIANLVKKNLISSAIPVAKGGLFFSLIRSGWVNELGFDITTDAEIRRDAFLFGESMGRIVVTVDTNSVDNFVDFMSESKVPFFTLGHVTKGEIRIDDISYGFIDKMSNK